MQRRAPPRCPDASCAIVQPKPPSAVDRILKRLRGDEGSDHASKFMAIRPPPVDGVAEAKRIMKRARGDDSQQNAGTAKWRQVETEAEAMESADEHQVDTEQMSRHKFDEQQYVWNDCLSSQFDSCDEDMEAPGKGGQGECLDGGKSHPHPSAPQRPSYPIIFP